MTEEHKPSTVVPSEVVEETATDKTKTDLQAESTGNQKDAPAINKTVLQANPCFTITSVYCFATLAMQFGWLLGIINSNIRSLIAVHGWTEHESTVNISLIVSMGPVGGVVGCFFAPYIVALGRWRAAVIVDVALIIAGGITLYDNVPVLICCRFVQGFFGHGVVQLVVPRFIDEFAPAHYKSRLGALMQFQICMGLLLAFTFGLFSDEDPPADDTWWRVSFAVSPALALLHLLYLVLVFRYETPRGALVCLKSEEQFQKVVRKIYRPDYVEEACDLLRATATSTGKNNSGSVSLGASLCDKRYRRATINGFFIAFFFAWNGVAAIEMYSSAILHESGINHRVGTFALGIVFILGMALMLCIVDKFGRKTLLIAGHSVIVVSHVVTAIAFVYDIPWLVLASIVVWSFAFECSTGSLVFMVTAETCTDTGFSVSIFSMWTGNIITSAMTPYVMESSIGEPGLFLIFAAFTAISVVYFACLIKESKGLTPLECKQLYWTEEMKAQYAADGNTEETEMARLARQKTTHSAVNS